MLSNNNPKQFLLVLFDHDNGIVNIVGPMEDDTHWNSEIVKLQRTGRKVNCQSIPASSKRFETIKEEAQAMGFTFSEEPILDPPEDARSEYRGSLPKYAQNADRKRVIKVLCKGKCGRTRWAEMNENYPGNKSLRDSDLGDFRATCLVCGKIAEDCYNWTR